MKINGSILALCAFHPWVTTGFLVQPPKSLAGLTRLNAAPGKESSQPFPTPGDAPGSSGLPGVAPPVTAKGSSNLAPKGGGGSKPEKGRKVQDSSAPVTVQGGSLKTWSFMSPLVERVQVVLKTEGRPLETDIELWQGPDNTPTKMRVYVEDGSERPFNAVIETPRGPNTIAIRNTAQMEFPLLAYVVADTDDTGPLAVTEEMSPGMTIQGGALRTYPFDPSVESVQVLLKTDGRPLNARIELLQGPNNNKQVIELYTEDGLDRPFFAVIEAPGSGNVVRVVNTATVEFPMTAWVEPYMINQEYSDTDAVLGGDDTGGFMSDRQWNK